MAFTNKNIKFILFDEEENGDKTAMPLDAKSTTGLLKGFDAAFKRSERCEAGVIAVVVLSDEVYLPDNVAKELCAVIFKNGGSIISSFGTQLQVSTKEGETITLKIVGGSNVVAAASCLLPVKTNVEVEKSGEVVAAPASRNTRNKQVALPVKPNSKVAAASKKGGHSTKKKAPVETAISANDEDSDSSGYLEMNDVGFTQEATIGKAASKKVPKKAPKKAPVDEIDNYMKEMALEEGGEEEEAPAYYNPWLDTSSEESE